MHIAKSVQNIANRSDPLVRAICSRRTNVDMAFVDQVLSLTQFTWHGRRPISGFDRKGNPRASDLDLLSVMVELARRGAHIRLPGYENMLPWEIVSGEQHVGTDRYGKIIQLISHQEHLSFSVRILDKSVINHESKKAGAPRTYSMVDYNGNWNQGWRGVKWRHAKDEAEFFAKNHLLNKGELTFKHYVHPNRKQSIFGRPYLLLKPLTQRLNDEIKYCKAALVSLEKSGIAAPPGLLPAAKPVLARGRSRNVFVRRFVMKLSGLELTDEYSAFSVDQASYVALYKRQQELIEQLLPMVQFVVRADEAAFYRYGSDTDFVANWIRGPRWSIVTDGHAVRTMIRLCENLSLQYVSDEVAKAVAA